ncbi:sulfite exporter TauE/SafE family protein [Octadecabacter sp. 1_MG-2023]|uniref:sulfite exporter TauE/SafE family protein n=1 Tax=unclassified Octadecabacter TaxID=196158 RepID=UPI001C07F44E|nr:MULTISPECIES: sulfite exporter TauE/SafE family protein [unclassified Octadecabacter]MBU2993084.1 sulfite exporter TauE/SafE family protein [Octadecabacter sp. B2R22]MDO6733464.1 sulfite exporter TauE/SafE family protein [Octadecabacter sp. 1_MG-2023]
MPEMSVLLPLIGLLMVIGAFAGVLAGLLGVGGGIVLVPAFFYAFSALGYDSPQLMQVCLATSLATIIVTSLRSLNSHNKKGAVEWGILRGWGVGIVIGAIIGVMVATQLRSVVLQALFGGLGICIGIYMAFGKSEWRLGDEMPRGLFRTIGSPVIGFLSVLMGIGGGSFGVPTMTLFGVPIHRAVATASGYGVIIALPAVIGFLFADIDVAPPLTVGAVNFGAFAVVVCMTLITAPWGAALAHKMDPKPLKRVFGVFLILVALNMLRKVLIG